MFTYTYDAVGNRLTQTIITNTTVYTYDIANRLINVGGVAQTWDNNGNLLNDGVFTYTYDSANRPITIKQGTTLTYTYNYNGLGDRVKQIVNGVPTTYTLDLNAGLTQVLVDGTNTYLYGNGRIAQQSITTTAYFLGDALGSVRQLANASGAVTLAKSYQPYGSVLSSAGTASSMYGWAGEQADNTGLVFLRARYYAPGVGRFITADPSWQESNLYQYAASNPIMFSDPTGELFWALQTQLRVSKIFDPNKYRGDVNLFAHAWIEKWLEENNGSTLREQFWKTHLEFPGRTGGPDPRIDAIVFSRVGSTDPSPVFYSSQQTDVTAQVFEIEPVDNALGGIIELGKKLNGLHSGKFPLRGTLPEQDKWPSERSMGGYAGAPYDWRVVRFKLGDRLSPTIQDGPVEVGIGVAGVTNSYYIMRVAPGLILYQDKDTLIKKGILVGGGLGGLGLVQYFRRVYEQAKEKQKIIALQELTGPDSTFELNPLCNRLPFFSPVLDPFFNPMLDPILLP